MKIWENLEIIAVYSFRRLKDGFPFSHSTLTPPRPFRSCLPSSLFFAKSGRGNFHNFIAKSKPQKIIFISYQCISILKKNGLKNGRNGVFSLAFLKWVPTELGGATGSVPAAGRTPPPPWTPRTLARPLGSSQHHFPSWLAGTPQRGSLEIPWCYIKMQFCNPHGRCWFLQPFF